MSSIPNNLARVPNTMASRLSMGYLNRTNLEMLRVSEQISSGRSILRPSDDIIKSATISVLDDRLGRAAQVQRNLTHASASLDFLDSTLASIIDKAREAKDIASGQASTPSTPSERATIATTIDGMIQGLLGSANSSSVAGYIFGGSLTSRAPVEAFGTGFRYRGQGTGLTTDLGSASGVPITLGATALTGVSSRVKGSVDLNPALTLSTPLSVMKGARGLGVSTGTIEMSIDGSTPISVDLAGAVTVQDVTTRIASAVAAYETANSVTILGPGGVGVSGGSINIDVDAGPPVHAIRFSDVGSGNTAKDLGLAATTPFDFTNAATTGLNTDPRLTWQSPVASLLGVTGALGSIRIANAGRTAVVDLSTANTLEDVRNAIESANLGVRVKINAAGTGIDVFNEVSAGSAGALSISEVTGSNLTATRLGIRTFSGDTRVQDLNFGRGIQVVDGVINQSTGIYDQSLNNDFRIMLGDASHTVVDIDLRPTDLTSVQNLLDRINAQLALALPPLGLAATDLVATLADGANGIVFVQNSTFSDPIEIKPLNNSKAAEQLGLLNARYDFASATLSGEDRAKVRVDDLFTRLIDLRDGLLQNNTLGITLAGEDLNTSLNSLVETRGTVGGYAKRVDDAVSGEASRSLIDELTRNDLLLINPTEAYARFAMLQTQLEAGLRVTAMAQSRTLLDFLG